MNKRIFILFIFVILLISCAQQYSKNNGKIYSPLSRDEPYQNAESIKERNVTVFDLKTGDNVNIKGTFYKGKKNMSSIILLHMLNRDRHDWDGFAESLQSLGYNLISIDLRGHGESSLSWKTFSESDFSSMILDVRVAKDFLVGNNVSNRIAIIGASIGANIALTYAAKDDSIKTIILLSPGLDYRGVKTQDVIKQFKNPVLIIASEGDTYSADSSRTLSSLSKNSQLKLYKGLNHGTNLLGNEDVNSVIIEWLKENRE